ncbi:hypothetical protein RvY_14076 [Ramazzottius varieornatus]|uniref:EamA domain-containing protein n=1 Tax=Ramazzottius varieornatus TaxID=947166 RepID=A0A1D1VS56_RAMVA|nr:hypothetical protein RvY_14076 [Ramazzottius varieornatus]
MKEESAKFLKQPALPKILITPSSATHLDQIATDLSDEEEDKVNVVPAAPPEGEGAISAAQAHKNWLLALLLLLVYITLVVTSSQLTSSAFNDVQYKPYKAPFLFIWCKIAMRMLAFPFALLIQSLIRLCQRHPVAVRDQWRHCTKALRVDEGQGRVGVRIILWKFFPMSITMLLMQIGWIVGLVHAPASIVTALCAGTIAFSYLLSWLVLKNKMLLIKGIFVIVAFVGIGLISYASTTAKYAAEKSTDTQADPIGEAFVSHETVVNATELPLAFSTTSFAGANVYLGVFCGLGAAIFYSLHQLTFKQAFKQADFIQVSLIMSIMSIFICIMYLPVPLIINAVGYERWEFAKMPWGIMFISWCFAFISSVSYAYGLALSNPFFMSVAEVAIVALSTGIDAIVRQISLSDLQIAGVAIVALAFIFMVMPDQWISVKLKTKSPVDNIALENGSKKNPEELEELNPVTHPVSVVR